MATVHIIGAGVSGLAAASRLAEAHVPVKLYEATAHAGGRARSRTEEELGTVDNGLHLIGADAVEFHRFLTRIHASDAFADVPFPLRTPAAPLMDYVESIVTLLRGRGMVEDGLHADNILRHHWLRKLARLLLHSKLEALPTRAARRFFWRGLRHPRRSTRLRMATQSLDAAIATPALTFLDYHGAGVYFSHALKTIEWKEHAPYQLHFARKKILLGDKDVVILATPAGFTHALLPQLPAPLETHSAITLHFAVEHGLPERVSVPEQPEIDLIRMQPGRISLTIRVGEDHWARDEEALIARLWRALQKLYPALKPIALPPHSIWRDKRAGHRIEARAAMPPELPPRMLVAGDWLDASLPATLEHAAATGHRAAEAALAMLGDYPSRDQTRLR